MGGYDASYQLIGYAMRDITRTTAFKKDFKREKRTDASVDAKLRAVLVMLIEDEPLPVRLRDHALTGEWKDHRDCHLKPDLVLIYRVTEDEVSLVRLGSHSELFG
jgi:mRNA interferase YafQ